MRFPLALVLVIAAAACGGGGGDPGVDAGPASDARDPCLTNRVPLVTTRADGVADSQVVAVTVDGRAGWLALDTGSPLTFVFGGPDDPEYVEDGGWLALGCEAHTVPAIRFDTIDGEDFEGLPILGILGLDFFGAVGEIDYPGGTLARHPTAPADLAALPSAPLVLVEDRLLVDVVLDGAALRLMLDAGAHDTLWLGVEGDADDEVGYVEMADGTLWEVWFGTGQLALGADAPREVPVIRGLANDYIGPELEELGAHGLLGLTSVGWRRIGWDAAAGELYLDEISKDRNN